MRSFLKQRLKTVIIVIINFIRQHPALKNFARRYLKYFPKLDMRLRVLSQGKVKSSLAHWSYPSSVEGLSSQASRIYRELKAAVARNPKEDI